jgi:hypothetical protein
MGAVSTVPAHYLEPPKTLQTWTFGECFGLRKLGSPSDSSLLNLVAEAMKRLEHHRRRGDTGIFIAEIDTSSLYLTVLDIKFADITIRLPAWADNQGTIFISMRAVREYLRVQNGIIQGSEWLALDYIPINMIHKIKAF